MAINISSNELELSLRAGETHKDYANRVRDAVMDSVYAMTRVHTEQQDNGLYKMTFSDTKNNKVIAKDIRILDELENLVKES